jgi:hypothetical protein
MEIVVKRGARWGNSRFFRFKDVLCFSSPLLELLILLEVRDLNTQIRELLPFSSRLLSSFSCVFLEYHEKTVLLEEKRSVHVRLTRLEMKWRREAKRNGGVMPADHGFMWQKEKKKIKGARFKGMTSVCLSRQRVSKKRECDGLS